VIVVVICVFTKFQREGKNISGVDGRIILIWIFQKWDWIVDWIDLAQDMDRCWVYVYEVVTCG
jgi:hypothetical protein